MSFSFGIGGFAPPNSSRALALPKKDFDIKTSFNHPGNLLASLVKLKCNGDFCDVTITCKHSIIKAHKVILGSATDYFKAMFLNETKEAKSGVVDFPEMLPEVVKQTIGFIYSGKVKISMRIARDLLDASEMMQLPELSKLCVEFLAERVDMGSCADLIRLSILYNKGFLNESVKTFLKNNFTEFSQSHDFSALEFNVLKIIFDLLQKNTESVELQKWKAIVMWTNANLESRECRFLELFQMVNLKCMSESVIKTTIWTNSLVSRSAQCLKLVGDVLISLPVNKEKGVVKLQLSKAYDTSHVVSLNGVTGLIPESGLARFEALKSSFPTVFNFEMDLIYHEGVIYVSTGLKIYVFTCGKWTSYSVDFSKVKRNRKSLTCSSCYKDHWYLGQKDHIYKNGASDYGFSLWTCVQDDDYLRDNLPLSHCCKNCKKAMPNSLKTSCYSRCIGIGDSVYMLTMNYVVEYRISTSQLIYHNVVVGLGNGFRVAASNDQIYALGGNGTDTKAVAFDLVTFHVIQLPNMSRTCTFGYSVFKSGKLYACNRDTKSLSWSHVATDSQFRGFGHLGTGMKILHPPTPIHFGCNLLMNMPQAMATISQSGSDILAKRSRYSFL